MTRKPPDFNWDACLEHRLVRLGKLIELKAPITIIASECRMVLEAAAKGEMKAIKQWLETVIHDWRMTRRMNRIAAKYRKQGLSEDEIADRIAEEL